MNNRILIAGGGIAGLTTAIALQQKQLDFLVLEAVPEIKAVGAGITLAGNAMRALRKINISDDVKKQGHMISSMIIQDEKGKVISVMDAEKLSRDHGLDNVAIHRAALHEALVKHIPAEKIKTNKKVTGFREGADGLIISLDDETQLEGSALIVADGINSLLRQKLIPASLPRYSGYTCWRGVAENKWGIEKDAVEVWGPSGRFGYVPIGNNKLYWFACKNAPCRSETMRRYTVDDLENNFKTYVSPVASIIGSTRPEDLIWSDIADLEPLSQFAFNRVLLVGDAGHATTPNLGQGACLGIEDALLVAEEISRQPAAIAKAFQSFEQKRLQRTHFIVNTSYRLGKVAQVENPFLAQLRNTLFRLMPDWVNEKQLAKVLDIPELG